MTTDNIPRTRSQEHPEPGALASPVTDFAPSGRCDVCIHGVATERYCAGCQAETPEAIAHTRRVASGDVPAQPSTILAALEKVAKRDGLAQYIAGDNRSRLIVVDGSYVTLYPASGISKVLSNWEATQWITWNLRRHTPADEVCPSCKANVKEGELHMSEAGLRRLQRALEEDGLDV